MKTHIDHCGKKYTLRIFNKLLYCKNPKPKSQTIQYAFGEYFDC